MNDPGEPVMDGSDDDEQQYRMMMNSIQEDGGVQVIAGM